jgi:hypothetical protein
MQLSLGLCYAVLMADDSVIEFHFLGASGPKGEIQGESPPGSGRKINLVDLLRQGYKAYWEIDCPKK